MKILKRVLILLGTAAGLCLLADYVIVTDAERIADLIDRGESAVEEENLAVIVELLSSDFEYEGMERDRFRHFADSILKKYAPMDIILMKKEITFSSEERASVRFMALTSPRGKSLLPGLTRSSWELRLMKEDGAWRITGIELVR